MALDEDVVAGLEVDCEVLIECEWRGRVVPKRLTADELRSSSSERSFICINETEHNNTGGATQDHIKPNAFHLTHANKPMKEGSPWGAKCEFTRKQDDALRVLRLRFLFRSKPEP